MCRHSLLQCAVCKLRVVESVRGRESECRVLAKQTKVFGLKCGPVSLTLPVDWSQNSSLLPLKLLFFFIFLSFFRSFLFYFLLSHYTGPWSAGKP